MHSCTQSFRHFSPMLHLNHSDMGHRILSVKSLSCCGDLVYNARSFSCSHRLVNRFPFDDFLTFILITKSNSQVSFTSSTTSGVYFFLLFRSIGQRQVTLQRDLMNSCQLEAENAMQRRLVKSF